MIETNINLIDILVSLKLAPLDSCTQEIRRIAGVNELSDGCLSFVWRPLSQDRLDALGKLAHCVMLIDSSIEFDVPSELCTVIRVANPKFAMARLLAEIEVNRWYRTDVERGCCSPFATIAPTVSISERARIEEHVTIEPFAHIGDNVTVGTGSTIRTGARLVRNVRIGHDCIIGQNSVVGGGGFGMCRSDSGHNFRIPHLGGVVIGHNVEVGALSTVCSGTLSPTVIEDYVKMDDHVHVAHNTHIGEDSIVTAGAVFSGSVRCGRRAWIAPNCTIIQGLSIGDESTVGIGAVVVRDLEPGTTVFGNPAKRVIR